MDNDGTDPADSTAPPPAPWWSRADTDQWGAPADTASTAPYGETTAYGNQPYGSAPYGATTHTTPYAGTTTPAPLWSAPAPTGAPAWGYPTDTIGGPAPAPAPKRAGLLAAVGTSLAVALIAGGTAGYVAGRQADDGTLTDPSASLGTGSSTSSSLNRAPESVAGIAARVLQSVVSVSVKSPSGSGTGSGVVIRSDGYILTNNHVVDAADPTVTVSFNGADNVDVPARIVGRDPDTDLAVIKVLTNKKVVPAALGQSRSLVVGDPVIAIGSPLGLAGTVTTGIVSALNRTVNVPGENGGRTPLFNAIQTDAAINPGNSGGALVDAKGQVIGINSAIATLGSGGFSGDQSGSIGVGFAIPIDEARSVAEELIRTGTATHPAVGVRALTSTSKGQTGALVQEVLAGGAAAQAGLQAGDLITAIDKTQVESVDELIVAIRQHKVGQTVTVTYYRDGAKQTATVTLQDNKGS
ncbi:MAG: putative serine protease PepD [Actinomycetota bacterium]|jgi:putative serine protease PepD|nr:putative serine protease PepD [Actinomycetota bacterium]